MGLEQTSISDVLAALASRSEPHAAGVASAFTTAAAAALVELTSGLAADRIRAEGAPAQGETEARIRVLGARAGELRERLLIVAAEDTEAYAAVIGARQASARARALAHASDPPLAIAESAAEVAEAAAEIAATGNWAFSGDAVAAAKLAAAAAEAGEEMVAANLADHPDDPRIARAHAAAERARRAATASA